MRTSPPLSRLRSYGSVLLIRLRRDVVISSWPSSPERPESAISSFHHPELWYNGIGREVASSSPVSRWLCLTIRRSCVIKWLGFLRSPFLCPSWYLLSVVMFLCGIFSMSWYVWLVWQRFYLAMCVNVIRSHMVVWFAVLCGLFVMCFAVVNIICSLMLHKGKII